MREGGKEGGRKGGMKGGKDGGKHGVTMSERYSTIPEFRNSTFYNCIISILQLYNSKFDEMSGASMWIVWSMEH